MINPYVTLALTAALFLVMGFFIGALFTFVQQQEKQKKEFESNEKLAKNLVEFYKEQTAKREQEKLIKGTN